MAGNLTTESPAPASGRPLATSPALSPSPPEKIEHVLARRLIWFRGFRRLTQAEVATLAGISRSAVNDAESGQSQVTIRTLQLLAAALGTNAGVLLGCMDPAEDVLREDARRRRF
jgi:DNA-binding XRE family transcriptional regulator